MGWGMDGAEGHEGWVANVLGDGRISSATAGGGVVVKPITAADRRAGYEVRTYATGIDELIVPWSLVRTWQVRCECGWSGSALEATADSEGRRDCPEAIEVDRFLPEWEAHVAPFVLLSEIGEVADRLRETEDRLGERVAQARALGASWAQIGRSVGLSKQGAQQRWGGAT